ncbi:MAG: hypothetical protein COT61_05365 [Candidatus Portnoybacteria bacterium CG09_land_8_20_14_0_10_44_13]|uniref:Uncharacterized protein n=4 Tax=Candidatus Portnoyibacteriota TaxID=1817913 RepID=A0A2H0KQC3_9BACT|nr:MAG: hypothetical protein AUK17_03860 [Parcubacteria group bacterium CG2_30_44_18]PIQ74350.1 MAG: hypothetical protein COV85_02610 [Candidatus Portnoybacteria bacterium CG11_big_fil_rev_8_21_14_0_20_44_10]PIS16167.1 MAG: hypothetical protein COT61_05365 [Candidatus Portnoybacteria bacterium CG09_land_8_20_14_0_10_44_13]PIZ70681.1 MAG: hypothetical protein COY11_02345 [Candidatus Portnoybacteria bacterium CG_4_10_14_0_2_um_filter_44_20]PJA63047.1 MAG: hypothetical protein CO161_03080 [Candida
MANFSLDVFSRKTIGWLLLFAGLVIIFLAIFSSYNIFTGAKEAPALFRIEPSAEVSSSLQQPAPGVMEQDLQEQAKNIIQGQIGEQLKEMMPAEFISKIFNLMSWVIFVSFLVFAGGRIAGIGAKLIAS